MAEQTDFSSAGSASGPQLAVSALVTGLVTAAAGDR